MQLENGETLKDYLVRLSKTPGIQKIGGGTFSQVFQHPAEENVVVKVVTSLDTTYNTYLEWCCKNQHNPFVPRIYERHEYHGSNDPFNIIFMEKLKRFANGPHFASRLTKIFSFPSNKERVDTLDALKGTIKYGSQIVFLSTLLDLTEDFNASESFKDVVYFIYNTFDIEDYDLHWCNAMLRGDQIVITDPVATVNWRKLHVGETLS